MGTGKTVPVWVNEIQIMREFGWTEKELYEEVSLMTVGRIGVFLNLLKKAEEFQAKRRY